MTNSAPALAELRHELAHGQETNALHPLEHLQVDPVARHEVVCLAKNGIVVRVGERSTFGSAFRTKALPRSALTSVPTWDGFRYFRTPSRRVTSRNSSSCQVAVTKS